MRSHLSKGRCLAAAALTLSALGAAAPATSSAIDPPRGTPDDTGIYESDCQYMCSYPFATPSNDRDMDDLNDIHENGARVHRFGRDLHEQCLQSGYEQLPDGGKRRLSADQCDRYYPPEMRATEFGYPTDPQDPDTDSDGLEDGPEVHGFDYDPLANRVLYRATATKPDVWDTDRDGFSDGMEVRFTKTNPRRKDTDRDGLTDRNEGVVHRTNARRRDTDGDCRTDGYEVRHGTDPLRINVGFVILYCSSRLESQLERQYPSLHKRRPPRRRAPADPCKRRRSLCRRPPRLFPTPIAGRIQAVVRSEELGSAPAPDSQPEPASPSPADLVVASIDSLAYDRGDDRCVVRFTRRNQGGVRSGDSDTSVTVSDSGGSYERSAAAASLDAGESRSEAIALPGVNCLTGETSMKVTVVVDWRRDIAEGNEENNAGSRTFG